MTLFAVLGYLAPIVSIAMIAGLAIAGDLSRGRLATVIAVCAAMLYAQFYGSTPIVSALGLLVQTFLAIYLLVRWRLSAL